MAVLISLLIGFISFGITFFSGNILLDKTVYGQSFELKMAKQQFSKLQNYVKDEEITLKNLQRLNPWCSRGEKVYLTIYDDDLLIYESHTAAKDNSQNLNPDIEDSDNEFILTLADQLKVRTFLYYYAGDAFYYFMTIFSGLLAFAIFSLCFIVLVSRKVSYITQLKKELDILSCGQLEYPVTIIGSDELGKLAAGIDEMRCSIIRHQETEHQIRTANSELITAMSHDLRTPLTSLLAYLEIIDRKKFKDEKQLDDLIHKSVRQTMRIKQMADKLFSYSLAYATEWESWDMETIDADQLFQQVIEDYVYALSSKGMLVKTDFQPTSSQIYINIELIQRALDNLYSNLLKYADPTEIIEISYKREKQTILLSISNSIQSIQKTTESTSIGLNTSRRIVEYHKGRFITEESNNIFCVNISLPIH